MKRATKATTTKRRNKAFVGFWLDQKLVERLDTQAAQVNRSRSSLARRVLELGLKRGATR